MPAFLYLLLYDSEVKQHGIWNTQFSAQMGVVSENILADIEENNAVTEW